jgi:hypothetical protein
MGCFVDCDAILRLDDLCLPETLFPITRWCRAREKKMPAKPMSE